MKSVNSNSPIFFGWYIVATCFFIAFLTVGVRNAFGIFVIPMSEEFGWTRTTISLAAASGFLINGITQPFLGHLQKMLAKTRGRFFGDEGREFSEGFTHTPHQPEAHRGPQSDAICPVIHLDDLDAVGPRESLEWVGLELVGGVATDRRVEIEGQLRRRLVIPGEVLVYSHAADPLAEVQRVVGLEAVEGRRV